MRDNIRAFVDLVAQCLEPAGPVYEFGSYLVEEQEQKADLRPLFPGRRYVGCDMRPGLGVDRVEDLSGLTLPDESVPTIVCVDTLEHVFEVRRAVDEMLRVLAPGGMIVLSAPLDFRVHNYPSDYWRITPSCMARLLAPLEAHLVGWQGAECFPHTILGLGFKAPVSPRLAGALQSLMARYQDWLRRAEQAVPWQRRLKQQAIGWMRSKRERRRMREFHRAQFAIELPVSKDWKRQLLEAHDSPETLGGRIDVM